MHRIGIIGTGIIANEHARAIGMLPGVTLVAASDVVADRLDGFARAFQVRRTYSDPAALIADPEVDIVAVTTPPSTHEGLAVAALKAGKYVICEKPLAHSLASANRIAAAAALHPGRLAVSHQLRYSEGGRRMRWLLDRNAIGDVRSALLERNGITPVQSAGAPSWWGRWDIAGGGVLLTQLIHEIDLLLQTMGTPLSVTAFMDTRHSAIESEDYVDAMITFAGGRTAQCVASVNSGHLGGRFVVRGTRGAIYASGELAPANPALIRELNRALPDTKPRGASSAARAGAAIARRLGVGRGLQLSPHAHFYADVASRIAAGAPLPIPPAEALRSLELCMAAYESALSGRVVSLPLAADSPVLEGVTKAAYDARPSKPPNGTAPNWRPPRPGDGIEHVPAAMQPVTADSAAVSWVDRGAAIARDALAAVGIDGHLIRAVAARPVAVHGGPRVRRMPWPRRRSVDRRERQAAVRVLDREMSRGDAMVYGGTEERAYCDAFANYMGGGFADAVNSGTNAVYIAIRALGLAPGSEVVVPPTTDAGGTMPVVLNLCIPVPADSMPGSVLTSADQIRAVMTDRTRAIVVAHIGGHPVDMDPILTLAAERNLPVIEDCAQAHGAVYKGRIVGTLGNIAAFSTMYAKHHVTGAQGGVVFTRDPSLFARVKQVADRGKTRDGRGHQSNVMASLNFNQDEIAMAIGRVQLAKLPGFLDARRAFAGAVARGLAGNAAVALVEPPSECVSAYLFLMFRLNLSVLSCDAATIAAGLASEGIDGAAPGYSIYPTDQPWHREGSVFAASTIPWSMGPGERPVNYPLPNARAANETIVRLDIHESLGVREARDVAEAMTKLTRHFRTR